VIELEAGSCILTDPERLHITVKMYVVPLPVTPLTLGKQDPTAIMELEVTPVTLALNVTVTVDGL
jgi:hypothetical protein